MARKSATERKADQFDAQFSIHSLTQIIKPRNTPSEPPRKSKDVENADAESTLDLKNVESVVLEGIIRAFSKTNFKGNSPPVPIEDYVQERFDGKKPLAYKYVSEVPMLRATQTELLQICGLKENSIAHRERLVSAIKKLSYVRYVFYYERLEYDSDGNPIKDKDGSWAKEEVESVGTLFDIKKVVTSKNTMYYEIQPSSVFLDQRATYFVYIRTKWREEITQAIEKMGKNRLRNKVSAYTFRFIFFLYYQFEVKRRSAYDSKPYSINWPPEEIGRSIRMSESVVKHKKRRDKILQDAYEVAKQAGYIVSYNRGVKTDTIVLNHEMFYDPTNVNESGVFNKLTQADGEKASQYSSEQVEIFQHFHGLKSKLDKLHEPPVGQEKENEMKIIGEILSKRSTSEIKNILTWANRQKYWSSRLFTPERMKKNFDEAYVCFQTENLDPVQENKEWALECRDKLSKHPKLTLEVYQSYIEVLFEGVLCLSLGFDAKGFQEQVLSCLSKVGVHKSLRSDEAFA